MRNSIKYISLNVVASAMLVSVILAGCGEADPENAGNHKPDVNIVQHNRTIKVGEVFNLDGVAIDVDGDALTYKWKFVSKPLGSSATLTTDTTKKATFQTDKVGKYVIQFVAKDIVDAIGKDTITITAKSNVAASNGCTQYTEISGVITTDTTYNGCYKVIGDISVNNNALLTIEQGSTLVFQESTTLRVNREGALKAVGTINKPILFTGEQETAGFWEGLRFSYSNNVKNQLEYVTVEYGGGNGYANLLLDASSGNPCRIKVSNSTLQHSSKDGFWFDEGSIVSSFNNVISTKNSQSAGTLYASTLDGLDASSKFTGNSKDYITLKRSILSKDTTWKKLDVPVLAAGDISINKSLEMEAGSRFVFNAGTTFTVHSAGSLTAKGTKGNPILFTGEQKTAGFWQGLRFSYSNNVKNQLEYVTVEYGGGNGYANLLLDASPGNLCRIKVNSSIFQHGSKYGIWLDNGSITNNDIITSNSLIDNASGTIKIKN